MKQLIESKWEEILSLLETQYDISGIMINTWIRSLKIHEVKDNTVYFYVDEKLGENAVKFLYRKEFDIFLLSSIRETLNDINIEIVIDEKKNYISEEPEKKVINSSFMDAISRSNLNPKYTFETFIVGDGNRHAHATCLAVADLPGQDNFNPLFLYGNAGLGKTHLMQSIAHYILERDVNKKVLYVSSETFTTEIIDAIRNHTQNEFREKYRKVDVLLIDDIQFIGGKEATQEEFFHTFNALYENKKQIVVASDRPPKEIKSLVDRLRNRFEMDLIADIQIPDIETRIAIIKRKADLMNIEIPNEVCDYIATNIKSNIRQLEGIVKKIKAKNFIEGEKPSVKSVQSIISDIINNDTPPEVTVEKIVEEVARTFNVSEEEMRSPNNRSAYISKPRQVAIYIVSKMTTLTQDSIGKEFGGRDHSTIKYAIDTTKKNINKDSKLRSVVDDIIKNCSN